MFAFSFSSILILKFSSTTDNARKQEMWEEVAAKAKSLELATATRDAAFVKDKVWGVAHGACF